MPGKQLFEIIDLNGHNFPSNFKRPKIDAVRSFPVNCGTPARVTILFDTTHPKPNVKRNSRSNCDANACYNSLSNIKRPKVDVIRDFPKHCGPFAPGISRGESEQSGDAKNLSHSDVSKYEAAIPAVPLRIVPTTNVESNPERSLALHDKDDVGIKMANNDNKVCTQEESWNCDLGKVTTLITGAEELVNLFACKEIVALEEFFPESKGVHELPCLSSEPIVLHQQTPVRELRPPLEVVKQEKGLSEKNMVESQGIEIVDLVDSCSLRTKSDQQTGGEGLSDCELTETKCVKKLEEHSSLDLHECASLGTKEQDESLEKFNVNYHNAIVVNSDLSNTMVNNNDESNYSENQKQLINLSIVQHEQPQGYKVFEALKMFEEQYTKVLQEDKVELRKGKGTKYPHLVAAERVKAEGMWIYTQRPFGHIPGIEIGHEFRFRTELAVIGLHRQLVSGIDYVVLDGKKFATSVVNSGRYENNAKEHDVLIYCGQGGNRKISKRAVDQKLEKGNLALVNSMEMRYPVRVTYKRKRLVASKGAKNEGNFVYVYDGLYTIKKFWDERDQNDKLVFKFELHRMSGQPRAHQPIMCREMCMVDDDVSQGKENKPIYAMNGVDDDRPQPFIYIKHVVYPHWFQHVDPIGCNCVNGCSDSKKCSCVLKNGGEIPFNENGSIIKAKPLVHECGPSCKCPPTCMNRVSQHGPRHELEIFKTKSRGWGLRSRSYISSGSFICEYVGELLREKEAEQRIGNDEYLFDICDDGFVIDAAMMGNIGRFINHSCSPNLYAQEVLYDHDDKRTPHIMFFATKNISPLQELTYDYNYKMGQICDANGNIKWKDCHCGSRKCTGRMY